MTALAGAEPTLADLVEQVDRLTRRLAELESQLRTLDRRPGVDAEVARLTQAIPVGWSVGILVHNENPSRSICRNSQTGEWALWDSSGTGAQLATGRLEDVIRASSGSGRASTARGP